MAKQYEFPSKGLPYVLVLPQMIIVAVFFFWPAAQAIWQSFYLQDPFGGRVIFVGLENYAKLLSDVEYGYSFGISTFFAAAVALSSMVVALFLAVQANKDIRLATFYKTMLIWPYAVATMVAGVLWLFMFNPNVGVVAWALKHRFREIGAILTVVLLGVAALATIYVAIGFFRLRGRAPTSSLLSRKGIVRILLLVLLWTILEFPRYGLVPTLLNLKKGLEWNHLLDTGHAVALITIAASWKQIAYNFVFFLAGLQSVPATLVEAAAIDGASPGRRFWNIIFPLLSPTTFYLLVMNLVYGFFETFPIIHQVTGGGPGKDTHILVYKVWRDGVINLDLGGSAAQSVILMILVIGLTVVQFRFIERKVTY